MKSLLKILLRNLLVLTLLLLSNPTCAAFNATSILLPIPKEYTLGQSTIHIDTVALDIQSWPDKYNQILSSKAIYIDNNNAFRITQKIVNDIPPEGYRLNITPKSISIEASDNNGFFWAATTLNQLITADPDTSRPIITEALIYDYPAFPIRGFMMDTGRSFISIDEIKKVIELMSLFKLNVFHWHLTDNQAWRIESKIFPQLNDSANMTRHHGKYYTASDTKQLLQFAKEHNVTIIPEIELPGHSDAFTRTFGFDMQSPKGASIVKQLVEEFCDIFQDSPYIHIGTDEAQFTNPSLIPEIIHIIHSKGKKVAAWNPGWNYKPGQIDLLQMWSYRGHPIDSIPAVDMRFHYINHYDTYADIRALYRSSVYHAPTASDSIAGAMIALWNDRYIENEQAIIRQNNTYPLLLTLAESTWRGNGTEYFDSLGVNMAPPGSKDHTDFADFEQRLIQHLPDSTFIPYFPQAHISWTITDPFPNEGNLNKTFPPETLGIQPSYTYEDSIYYTQQAHGAAVYLRHVWGTSVPAFFTDPKPNHTAYAMTNVYSHTDQPAGLLFETQNYSRSEPDLPPPSGSWDYRCSKIWINGLEILPPVWLGNHHTKNNETPLTNENHTERPPIPIHLHQGWNNILIKLPVAQFSTNETRLVKWMFTCVITAPDGKTPLKDLIFNSLPQSPKN